VVEEIKMAGAPHANSTFLLPPDLLSLPTPSAKDGIPADVELTYRVYACELAQELCVCLALPQACAATAQSLLQRFYHRRSFASVDAHHSAVAAVFLAGKVEECTRRMRDILNVLYHIKRKRQLAALRRARGGGGLADGGGAPPHLPPPSPPPRTLALGGNLYATWKLALIRTERLLLKDLGFAVYSVSGAHPHKFVLFFVRALLSPSGGGGGGGGGRRRPREEEEEEEEEEGGDDAGEGGKDEGEALAGRAWGYLNDSLRLDLCVRYPPEAIACAALYLAARDTGFPLPTRSPWWAVLGGGGAEGGAEGGSSSSSSFALVESISSQILSLYERGGSGAWLPSLRPDARPGEDEDVGEAEENAAAVGGWGGQMGGGVASA
jgi:cyclin L